MTILYIPLHMKHTIKQLLGNASQLINRLDAEVLLAHVLSKPREFLISHDTDTVSLIKKIRYNYLVKKRSQNYPAAQLMKTKGFFGLDFFVNKHTLIPRPDTELIVEEVLKLLPLVGGGWERVTQHKKLCIIDVGTGSGCIPVSIAKQITDEKQQPAYYASDISQKALKVAKKNAHKHNVQIDFRQGNLLEPFFQAFKNQHSSFIICANLPYLTEHQFQTEPSIKHEPKSALVADNEGLALYEELLQQIKQMITTYRLQVTGFFEIDPSQSIRMQKLVKQYVPKAKIEITKDLAKLDRIIVIHVCS